MARKTEGPTDFYQFKQHVLELAELERKLRYLLVNFVQGKESRMRDIGRKAGINFAVIRRFYDGQACLGGGRGVTKLSEMLQHPEIGVAISDLADQIGDRFLGFAICSPAARDVALQVVEEHALRAEDYSYLDYSTAFGPLAHTIMGVLNGSNSALLALEDEEVSATVVEALNSPLDETLACIRAEREARTQSYADTLNKLAKPIIQFYGSKTALAKALGVSKGTFNNALAARSTTELILQLTSKLETLASEQNALGQVDGTESSDRLLPAPPSPPPQESPPVRGPGDGAKAWADVGGSASEAGIEYVLSEASFKELEQVPLIALRESLKVAIRVARLQLNIGSQLKDKAAREILAQEIGPELQELELAIRTFTFAHPNELLRLYEGQRQVWASNASHNKQTTRGRTK